MRTRVAAVVINLLGIALAAVFILLLVAAGLLTVVLYVAPAQVDPAIALVSRLCQRDPATVAIVAASIVGVTYLWLSRSRSTAADTRSRNRPSRNRCR